MIKRSINRVIFPTILADILDPSTGPSVTMANISVSHMTESDIPRYADILKAAYYSPSESGISGILCTSPPTEVTRQRVIQTHTKSLRTDPTAIYLKAKNKESGEILACAKYHLYSHPRTQEEVDEAAKIGDEEIMPCHNISVYRALFQPFRTAHAEIMSTQPHIFLASLVTHPDHERKGCESLLLDWGLTKADELGLRVYLDATNVGKGLYEKKGFRVVREVPLDLSQFGVEGQAVHYVSDIDDGRRGRGVC